MKNKISTCFIMLLIFFGCNFPGNENNPSVNNETVIDPLIGIEKEIIVKVSDSISIDNIDDLVKGNREKTLVSFDGFSYVLYKISGNEDIENVLSRINSSNEGLVSAEQNHLYKMHDTVPADPFYANQYALKLTNCEKAWDMTTGSNTVSVAVIDTGINGKHEELSSRVIAGYNFIYSYSISSGSDSDDNGHGSHVAGIIGAAGNNSIGITGLAWNVNLMPIKVLDSKGEGSTSQIISGVIWAANNGANIINMSLGGISYSQAMADAINYAVKTKNITIVVSMGNDGCGMINYPAAYPGVIAVGSTNGRDLISSFSTTGNHISVSAPGENIYSLDDSNNIGYVYMSGTSMSSPFVSGVAALLLSKDNTLLPSEIKSILEDSAVDKGTTGYDTTYGYGRVDVNAALNSIKHNNYGSINVRVVNAGTPYPQVPVLLLNSTGTQTIYSGLTSNGTSTGGSQGEYEFSFVRNGTYKLKAILGGVTQTKDVTITSGENITVTFEYSFPTYDLIVNIPSEAGIVSLNPAGGKYISGTDVILTVNSNIGFTFHHWEGDLSGSSNPVTIKMNGNKTLNAIYTLPIPVISPSGGTFYNDQEITITSDVNDATIIYTMDGSTPTTTNGTIYESPFILQGPTTKTIKAIAYKTGWVNSNYVSKTFYFQVGRPSLSPLPGTYGEPQDVVISTETNGAIIRYTTDYTTPSLTNGFTYTDPIHIEGPSSVYLNAKAFKDGWAISNSNSGYYYFGVSSPTFSPSGGNYYSSQTVTISSTTNNVTIRYTTDGTNPSITTGTIYTEPFTVSGPGTVRVRAIAYNANYTSSTSSAYYYFNTSSPSFSPSGGYYTDPQDITITSSTPGASIRYTVDGTTPTSDTGTIYSGPISLSAPGVYTIKAIAYLSGCTDSSITSSIYRFQVSDPAFSPSSSYSTPVDVSITTQTSGATIRYTTDGSNPSSDYGTIYSSPVHIEENTTLKAIAYASGLTDSNVMSRYYYFYVSSPSFSPSSGTYSTPQNITITTSTDGASIRYTTDGSYPTSSSGTIYTEPIPVSETTTIRAIAYKSGWNDYGATSRTYSIRLPYLTFTPNSDSFTEPQNIGISSSVSGVTIKYTIDGSTPSSANGTVYTGPIGISGNTIIKAYSYKSGMLDSNVAVGTFLLNSVLSDTFETGDFSNNQWSLGGNVVPLVQNNTVYEGQYSVKFGTISHSQKSNFNVSVQNTNTSIISFCYKVSSESVDYFRFIVDGTTIKSDSGEKDWTYYSYTLSPGTHTLTWQYSKDGSVNAGSDTAWVDNIFIY